MPGENSEEYTVDPDVKEELDNVMGEDPMLTAYATPGGDGEEKTEFAKSWFPDSDEWGGKTDVTFRQARAMAMVQNFPKIFDELEELDGFLEGFIQDYQKLLTSVGGVSREQQAGILRSLFGGPSEQEETARSAVMAALAGENNDSDD